MIAIPHGMILPEHIAAYRAYAQSPLKAKKHSPAFPSYADLLAIYRPYVKPTNNQGVIHGEDELGWADPRSVGSGMFNVKDRKSKGWLIWLVIVNALDGPMTESDKGSGNGERVAGPEGGVIPGERSGMPGLGVYVFKQTNLPLGIHAYGNDQALYFEGPSKSLPKGMTISVGHKPDGTDCGIEILQTNDVEKSKWRVSEEATREVKTASLRVERCVVEPEGSGCQVFGSIVYQWANPACQGLGRHQVTDRGHFFATVFVEPIPPQLTPLPPPPPGREAKSDAYGIPLDHPDYKVVRRLAERGITTIW